LFRALARRPRPGDRVADDRESQLDRRGSAAGAGAAKTAAGTVARRHTALRKDLADFLTIRHPGLDPGSMNTACEISPRPCSWILTFVRMTNEGVALRETRPMRPPPLFRPRNQVRRDSFDARRAEHRRFPCRARRAAKGGSFHAYEDHAASGGDRRGIDIRD